MVTKKEPKKAAPQKRRSKAQIAEAVERVDKLVVAGKMTKTAACETVGLNVASYNRATKGKKPVTKRLPRVKVGDPITDIKRHLTTIETATEKLESLGIKLKFEIKK